MGESDESGGKENWNYDTPATARVTDKTADRLGELEEREGISSSEAVRRSIRAGLDELETDGEGEEEEDSRSVGDMLLAVGLVLGLGVAAGYVSGGGNPDQTLVYVTAALIGGGLLLRLNNQ